MTFDHMGSSKHVSPLIIFLFLSSLTFDDVVSHSIVEFLPGFDGPLPFTLRTGYIGVDEGEEVQLFYYFIESQNDPKQDPFLLWLTGGPSCSSISAIVYEIGPMKFEEIKNNGSIPRLVPREYAWTKTANILFVDLPVGTGFSYAKTSHANYSGDFKTSSNINQFLRKWFINYPEFVSNSLYIGGDSYSGFTLPLFLEDMLKGNDQGMKPHLNIKGYILGNPSTDRSIDHSHIIPFAHGMGLISDELHETLERSCKGEFHYVDPSNIECLQNIQAFQAGINGIQTVMILEEFCGVAFPRGRALEDPYIIRSRTERANILLQPPQLGDFRCRKEGYELIYQWMADMKVQEALHVRKGTIGEWRRCNYGFTYLFQVMSSVKYHANLSTKGIRSLIYSGDHDMVVPFLGTQAWIRSLNYSIVDDWRRWWVNAQIAGFTRTYSNRMTFATVKGAGHTAPEYKPEECLAMFERWINGHPL